MNPTLLHTTIYPFLPYLRQPAVLVRAVSHSRCLGLQFSSPPPAPLLPRSQPEWGTITSSERACSAWSTISIFTESWDDRFHSVPVEKNMQKCHVHFHSCQTLLCPISFNQEFNQRVQKHNILHCLNHVPLTCDGVSEVLVVSLPQQPG